MGPCVDFETGCKTEFLITHGHKSDRGIFCGAGRGGTGRRRSQPRLRGRLPERSAAPRAGSRGAEISPCQHRSPLVLRKCLHNARGPIRKTTALWKSRALLPQSMPGFLHSAREQRSFRLAHFINKVKQHVKKSSTSINGPSVSLTSSVPLIKSAFIAHAELKSSRSALLRWYLQMGRAGPRPSGRLCPPPPGARVGKIFFPIRI